MVIKKETSHNGGSKLIKKDPITRANPETGTMRDPPQDPLDLSRTDLASKRTVTNQI